MALPILTLEQRQQALAKAALARTARKQLREKLTRGEETLPSVLERAKTDPIVGKTKVVDLLKSLPGYGPATASVLMQRAGIAPTRRAAGLGERQRRALLDQLG